MNSYYSNEELYRLGLKAYGDNVLISRKSSIYGADKIVIGNNVRIDDFTIISGNIETGNFVHIAAYTALYGGKNGIQLHDFVTLSSRVVIYAESDNYSGNSLTFPQMHLPYRTPYGGTVCLKRHVIVGSGSTILPSVIIGTGTAVGAMSLVNKSLDEWGIYVGIPCRKTGVRSNKMLELEEQYMKERESLEDSNEL